ncbi:ABC transporter permease [Pseudofrankia sp. BMG5.37]|uniref:ABC transporter permease n=1 Tax=Pseudofrankia sp. BMG5.37 TaxID=3050035 RepID=UPI002895CE31|nr:ABC transporter permease [Pseudofrankia sp. BMG5.37]MDT3439285.1 ABC transporter permease [Pseudofrankia sp. BMG5.37]
MIRLVLRRLLVLLPMLFVVSFGVFLLVALVPGDPAVTLAGGASATPETIANVRAQLRLDDPLLVQYWHWLAGIARLDLGRSLFSGIPVAHEIAARLPVTLSLVIAATLVAVVIGVPLGAVSGLRPGGTADASARVTSSLGLAVPNFWLGVILVSLLAVRFQVFPPTGFTPISSSFTGWVQTVTLPAVALGLAPAAGVARQLRRSLAEVLESHYVRTAWAKGAGTTRVVVRHALKNAAIPAVTVLGVQIGFMLGGAVIIEQIFSIPGLGTYMLQGITGHDLPVVQGVTLVFVVFQMAMSLLVDLSYGYLNPKVRVA